MFPSSETISQNVEIRLEVKDVKINSGLKDEDFK
jgi:outer membrane lipoprotein-sorting protein